MIVPAGPERAESIVMNSRFIASLDYAASVEEARAFIGRIRREFPTASHNVAAFVVGGGNSRTEYCTDDGEPSGTSGKPLLAVLRGSGLGDAVVVVTRYFGGTLLGTGGLSKAYSGAGRMVLEKVGRAALCDFTRFRLELPYSSFDALGILLAEIGAEASRPDFSETVRLAAAVPTENIARFLSRLADISSGAARAEAFETLVARRPLRDSGNPGR